MFLRFSCLLLFVFSSSRLQAQQPTQNLAADTTRLRQHLLTLVNTPQPRNYLHPASLQQVADYTQQEMRTVGAQTTEQLYAVQGQSYRNLIGSFGPEAGPRLLVGAHYDMCGEQPGADDNGSGVAALLELARLLGQQPNLPCKIDLVAYTLKEPPFSRTRAGLARGGGIGAGHGSAGNVGLLRRPKRKPVVPVWPP